MKHCFLLEQYCFKLFNQSKSLDEARKHCGSLGKHGVSYNAKLASVKESSGQLFLAKESMHMGFMQLYVGVDLSVSDNVLPLRLTG